MAGSESVQGVGEQPGAGSAALRLFRRLGGSGFGRRLCSWLICRQAPYFSSTSPLLEILEPGHCVASIAHKRRVQNHIGTVHAIALCNLAEFVGGLATDAAMTRSLRWIPKGMTVRYLKKAVGPMRGEATLDPIGDIGTGAERSARVVVKDRNQEAVFDAEITMWVSPKRTDPRSS